MPEIGTAINPTSMPSVGDVSWAIRVGNLVFCAGQIGIGPDGDVVGPTVEEQAPQAFENLKTVLAAAGASLGNVVKITAYLVDYNDKPAYVAARARYFQPPYPAHTLLFVKSLARPEFRVDVEAIAVVE